MLVPICSNGSSIFRTSIDLPIGDIDLDLYTRVDELKLRGREGDKQYISVCPYMLLVNCVGETSSD